MTPRLQQSEHKKSVTDHKYGFVSKKLSFTKLVYECTRGKLEHELYTASRRLVDDLSVSLILLFLSALYLTHSCFRNATADSDPNGGSTPHGASLYDKATLQG